MRSERGKKNARLGHWKARSGNRWGSQKKNDHPAEPASVHLGCELEETSAQTCQSVPTSPERGLTERVQVESQGLRV